MSKAEDLSWEALSKAKMMGEFEPRLAISLSNLAVVQRLRGRYDRAEDLSNIALRILQAVDSKGALMAKALLNSAVFFHDDGRWGEARRLYGKSIALLESSFNEALLCQALCLYSRLCSDQARYSQAETILKRVSSLEPTDPQTCIHYMLSVALNSVRQERFHRAEQVLAEADKLLGRRIDHQLLWKSSLLSLRAALMMEQYRASLRVSGSLETDISNRRRAVREALENALDIREQTLGPFHESCGTLHRKEAEFLFELCDLPGAEESLRRALSIALSSRGPYHPDTLKCLELSSLLLRATARHEEAEEMEERCRQVEKRVRELARETYVVWGEPEASESISRPAP